MSDAIEQALREMRFELPMGLTSRAIAGAQRVSTARRARPARWIDASGLTPLVAALLALAIVSSLLLASRALHQPPAAPAGSTPVPVAQLPFQFQLCQTNCTVATQPPVQAGPPVSGQCVISAANVCEVGSPLFATPTLGWITSVRPPQGPATLYRTEDGGRTWKGVISWDGGSAGSQIRSSAGGTEVLVAPSNPGTIYHTNDAGAHWQAYGFPVDSSRLPFVDFINPREGWIDAFPGILHTTDSGAHWTRVGTLGPIPFFFGSSFGVFTEAGDVYLSPDDGLTWRRLNLPRRAHGSFFNLEVQAFNSREGVLVDYRCATPACVSADLNDVYQTSDGGTSWSGPVRLPAGIARPIFIDASHWFAMTFAFAPTPSLTDTRVRSLMRTDDAGLHWQVLLSAPEGSYLPGWDWFSPTGFTDPQHGWTTGQGEYGNAGVSSLRVTSDGGRTWAERPLPNSVIKP